MVYGDYPPVMRKNVGSRRLPSFTDEERGRVKGSFDFVGFNHYVVVYVRADLGRLDQKLRDYMGDAAVKYDSKDDVGTPDLYQPCFSLLWARRRHNERNNSFLLQCHS
jgi:hypothetical protein